MAKRKSHIDELVDYQEHQYLPHTHHIQNGELPYSTRQLMNAPGRAALVCLLLAVMGLLIAVMELLQFLQDCSSPLTLIYTILAVALTVVCIIGTIQNFRKAKVAAAAKNIRKPAEKSHKKR